EHLANEGVELVALDKVERLADQLEVVKGDAVVAAEDRHGVFPFPQSPRAPRLHRGPQGSRSVTKAEDARCSRARTDHRTLVGRCLGVSLGDASCRPAWRTSSRSKRTARPNLKPGSSPRSHLSRIVAGFNPRYSASSRAVRRRSFRTAGPPRTAGAR